MNMQHIQLYIQLLANTYICSMSTIVEIEILTVGNFTTNLAEGYMQIRCKFDAGKQINRSQIAKQDVLVLL